MSSSKSWIVQSVKRRLGWTTVIAGAALVTTLVMGNSLVAAIGAIAIVLALSALIPSRGTQASDADYPSKRTAGRPFSISHAWTVDRKADLAGLVRALNDKGFALRQESQSSNQIVLRSGSQLWTRLFGGYFVNPRRLPIEVELRTANGLNNDKWTVRLGVRDRFGIAIRDEALEDRFALVAGII